MWLSDVTPTRRPARMSATAAFAPCHVFPEPGGPWTKRWLPSSESAASGTAQVEPRARQPPLEDLRHRASALAVEERLRESLDGVAVFQSGIGFGE